MPPVTELTQSCRWQVILSCTVSADNLYILTHSFVSRFFIISVMLFVFYTSQIWIPLQRIYLNNITSFQKFHISSLTVCYMVTRPGILKLRPNHGSNIRTKELCPWWIMVKTCMDHRYGLILFHVVNRLYTVKGTFMNSGESMFVVDWLSWSV